VSGKVRLGIILAMLAMVLAVSVPAMAQDVDECDFDEDDFVSEEEAEDCADALEDSFGLGADVDVVCVDDDDGDGFLDEDGDDDGEDDDEDGEVDEDDDCDPDDLAYVVTF
jgi:hypothetical protein